MVGQTFHGAGQQMGRLPLYGLAGGIDAEGDNRVQPQEKQVHKVFLTDAFGGQVGVQQAQAAQTLLPGCGRAQAGG